ncbi:hypothetical protein [Rhizobium leguminosarum]|uniref:hypothetical protein n=1 Tax=Rhizobium leguminosarum TaxID=384 RepID=UPI003CFD78FE
MDGVLSANKTVAGGGLTRDEREMLLGNLQQAFHRISPDGEMARCLLLAMPDVVAMASSGNGSDELELQCYRSPKFRSKLLLLVLVAKQRLIRCELEAIEESLKTRKPLQPTSRQNSILDQMDKVQKHIISWKLPISISFMDSDIDERTSGSARHNGRDGISEKLRWQ